MKILNENSLWSRDEKLIYDGISKYVWTDVGRQGYIPYVSVMEGTNCRSVLEVPIHNTSLRPVETVIKVNLILTAVANMTNQYICVGTTEYSNITLNAGEKLYVDITSYYCSAIKSGKNFCDIPVSSPGVYMSVTPPQFERDVFVEYTFRSQKLWNEAKTNVDVAGALTATHNLLDGTVKTALPIVSSEDSVLGQAITYAIESNGATHLSIEESLAISGTENSKEYIHTDTLGDDYGVTKYFYYDDDGKKTYILESQSAITLNWDGTLSFEGQRVYPEFSTSVGAELIPSPKYYKNGENFDTRSDELREVEEQIANYKEALSDYVIVQKDAINNTLREDFGMQFRDAIDDAQKREEFIQSAWDESNLLLTKSEAISYESLYLQELSLDVQKKSYDKNYSLESDTITYNAQQMTNIVNQMKVLNRQKAEIEATQSENVEDIKTAFDNKALHANTLSHCENMLTYYGNKKDSETNQEKKMMYEESFNNYLSSKLSVEQQIETCDDILHSYVILDKAHINDCMNPNSTYVSDYEKLVENNTSNTGTLEEKFNSFFFIAGDVSNYFFKKSDALSYLSIIVQIDQLDKQYKQLENQNKTLGATINTTNDVNTIGKADAERQISAIALQKATYLSYQDKVVEEFERKVKEYGILLERLNEIKQYEIVATIKDGDVLKGFNENGQIVLVSDLKGEKQARYEYEDGKVARLYDEDGNEVRFDYDSDNRIKVITDAKGKKTTYSYANGITVTHSNGVKITFTISSGKLIKVTNGYTGLSTAFEYTNEKVSKITQLSGSIELYSSAFTYGVDGDDVTLLVEDSDTTRTRYVIRHDMEIASKLTEKAGKMVEAIRYEGGYLDRINDYDFDNEEYVLKTYTYHRKELINAEFENADDFTSLTFNTALCTLEKLYPDATRDNQPTRILVENLEDKNVVKQEVFYTYDDKRRPVDEKSVIVIKSPANTFNTHTLYTYDNNGALVKKESYVEGEESTRGSDITEYVYDKDGREIRSISYNTLSHSDKIYSEREYSEDGKLKCEYDERGLHKTVPVYSGDTIIGAKYPNGSTFVKSEDKYGNTVAITQSTDIGEENSTDRVYENGLVKSVKSGNTTLEYGYDAKRRVTSVNLNGIENYATTVYEDDTTFYSFSDPGESDPITVDKVTTHVQGNVPVSTYTDKLGKLLEIRVDGARVAHTYDDRGNLTRVYDTGTYNEELYYYDGKDKLTRFDRGTYSETHFYNPTGEVTQSNIGGITYDYTYSDDSRRELESIAVSGETFKLQKDALGRNTGKEVYKNGNMIARTKINYVKHGDHTTNMPSIIQYVNGSGPILNTVYKTLKYAYDNMGNISAIYDNGKLKCRYEYDALNRLVREDNKEFGKTWTYLYDENGNILEKRIYTYTLCDSSDLEEKTYTVKNYIYSPNGDRLEMANDTFIFYNEYNQTISYNDMDCTWNKGKLAQYGNNTFTYDYQGRRISKNGIHFTYDSQGRLVEQSNGVQFVYDDTGVAGIKYTAGSSVYAFEKDAQGNIISILDSDGILMVRYEYDAWGNCKTYDRYGNEGTSDFDIANINPFRYRGYYYDVDTGLYYLPARYYDPTTGRFISADDIEYADPETINGLNLYAYCGNNPVMNIDPTGHSFTAFLFGFLIFGGLAFGATAYADYKDDGQVFNGSIAWYDYLGVTLFAGLTGGLLGLGFAGTSFSFGIPTFGLTTTGGALAIGVTGTITVTITGAQILTGLAVLGGIGGLYLFAKGYGPRMGHNQYEKKQWNDAMRKLKIHDKELQRRLHLEKNKYAYQDTYKGLVELLEKILKTWGIR